MLVLIAVVAVIAVIAVVAGDGSLKGQDSRFPRNRSATPVCPQVRTLAVVSISWPYFHLFRPERLESVVVMLP